MRFIHSSIHLITNCPVEIKSSNAYSLTEMWGWCRRTCRACPSGTHPQVQPTRVALHAAGLAGSCCQWLCQPHLCYSVQPNSWGEGCAFHIIPLLVTDLCSDVFCWRANDFNDLCICRLLPFVTWMNRGSRSTGYVFFFALWLWLVSFPSFYRFAT